MRINSFHGIGRLADNPDYKPGSGDKSSRCSFRLLINRIKSQTADVINCVVWGPYADVCAQHLKKGKEVAIEGELHTKSTKDEQGNWTNFWNIVCSSVSFGRDSEKNKNAPQPATTENVDELAKKLAEKAKGDTKPAAPSGTFKALVDALVKQGLTPAQATAVAKEELAKQAAEKKAASTKTQTTSDDPFSV